MEETVKLEISRRLKIWERMSNDPQTMAVARGLVLEMVEKLRTLKKSFEN